jgi:hypothetical protein
MKRILAICALAVSLAALGCFHATIETGLAPNDQVITQKWASCWVLGLVPPKTVEAAAKCPGGVSRVETQRSFLNGLVAMLTFSIYTPMEIVVTCSGARSEGTEESTYSELTVAANATPEEIRDAYAKAAAMAYDQSAPVYVRFLEAEASPTGL